MSAKARIGVIGVGSWATSVHIPGLMKNPDAEVVALCDRDKKRLDVAGDAFEVNARFTDYTEMLEKVEMDGAIIATSPTSHYEITRACLEKGLHVLCEKPLTIEAKHARALADLALAQKRELIVGYSTNYSPATIQMRNAIANNQAGEIRLVSGLFVSSVDHLFTGNIPQNEGSKQYGVNYYSSDYNDPKVRGGGHGNIQMTHLLGLFYFLTPLCPVQVQAQMRMQDKYTDLEDAMLVTLDNGAIATFAGTARARHEWRQELVIHAEKCCVTFDTSAKFSSIAWHPGTMQGFGNVSDNVSRWLVSSNLVDVVLGRGSNGSPASAGVRAVETLEAAYRSAAGNGMPVKVKELYSC